MDANYANKMLTCEICDYKCSRKADYERHLLTKKHLKNASKKACKTRKTRNIVDFTCKFCGMTYKHRPSLSRHLKKCKSVEFQSVDNANKMLICEKEANKKSVKNPEKDMEIKDLKIQNEQILEMVTNQKSLIYLLMIFILLQGLFMMYNSMTQSNLAYQVSQMNNNMLKI